jgi:hypothetical protein
MRKTLIGFCLTLVYLNSFAQEKYSFIGYLGLCDLRFVHPENLVYPDDEYKTNFSFKGGLYYDLLNSKRQRLYPTIGLTVTGKYPINYMGVHSPPFFGVTRDKFITMDLPISLSFQINNWLKIKGGVNGSALVMSLNRGPAEREIFTYGPLLGLSMRYRKYSFNIEYIREVNDMLKHMIVENASYRSSVLHFGIGYHFISFKQFKGIIR